MMNSKRDGQGNELTSKTRVKQAQLGSQQSLALQQNLAITNTLIGINTKSFNDSNQLNGINQTQTPKTDLNQPNTQQYSHKQWRNCVPLSIQILNQSQKNREENLRVRIGQQKESEQEERRRNAEIKQTNTKSKRSKTKAPETSSKLGERAATAT